MKDNSKTSIQLITDSYEKYHHSVLLYIYYRISNREEAKDLSQDVFLRLLEYKQILCPDTVKHFIFTIAHNLVIDYLRRSYREQEMFSYLYDTTELSSNPTESRVIVNNLQDMEKSRIIMLPTRRRRIYIMSRFEEKSAQEIASELQLSFRTVENHLFIGRKEVREYISRCI